MRESDRLLTRAALLRRRDLEGVESLRRSGIQCVGDGHGKISAARQCSGRQRRPQVQRHGQTGARQDGARFILHAFSGIESYIGPGNVDARNEWHDGLAENRAAAIKASNESCSVKHISRQRRGGIRLGSVRIRSIGMRRKCVQYGETAAIGVDTEDCAAETAPTSERRSIERVPARVTSPSGILPSPASMLKEWTMEYAPAFVVMANTVPSLRLPPKAVVP